jgi:hypothetical protein
MRRFIVLLVLVGGCSKAPVAPSVTHVALAVPPPQHHNIPATFAGHPEGPVIYLCATQPRQYYDVDGHPVGVPEEDHYLQYEQCPNLPIE